MNTVKRERERRRKHTRKRTVLMRLCYRFVRDIIPEVFEELRTEAGLLPSHRPPVKRKKKR
jgi:hypothetical protein